MDFLEFAVMPEKISLQQSITHLAGLLALYVAESLFWYGLRFNWKTCAIVRLILSDIFFAVDFWNRPGCQTALSAKRRAKLCLISPCNIHADRFAEESHAGAEIHIRYVPEACKLYVLRTSGVYYGAILAAPPSGQQYGAVCIDGPHNARSGAAGLQDKETYGE